MAEPVHPIRWVRPMRWVRDVLPAAMLCLAQCAPAAAAGDPARRALLDLIGRLEAPRGYDDYYRGVAAPPPAPLTAMTVAGVLAWQARIDVRSKSEAAGRYQITEATLRRLVRRLGVPGSARFDAALQDRLAGHLLDRAGWPAFRAGRLTPRAFGTRLAGTWAALPVLKGRTRGLSRYHGLAGNRALITAARMERFLAGLRGTGPVAGPAPAASRALTRQTSVIHDRPPKGKPPRRTARAGDPWAWD